MSRLLEDGGILRVIRETLENTLDIDPATPIDLETRFFADLGLASIDAVVLGEAIQAHYGRSIPFDQLLAQIGERAERDMSIHDLIIFLQYHLQGDSDPTDPRDNG
jgi:acyl carrier protein